MARTDDPRLDSVSRVVLQDVGSIDLTLSSHGADEPAHYELDGVAAEVSIDGETLTLRGNRAGAPPQAVAIEGSYVTGNVSIPSLPSQSPLHLRAMRRGEEATVVRLFLAAGKTIIITGYDRMITTTTPDSNSAATRNALESAAERLREGAEALRSRLLGDRE